MQQAKWPHRFLYIFLKFLSNLIHDIEIKRLTMFNLNFLLNLHDFGQNADKKYVEIFHVTNHDCEAPVILNVKFT